MLRTWIERLCTFGLFGLPIGVMCTKGNWEHWLLSAWIILITASISYAVAKKSAQTLPAMLKNVLVAATIFAAIAFIREGSPATDDDGFSEGGYDATFKDRCEGAVIVFLKIGFGGWLGCAIACELARRDAKDDEKA